MTQRLFVAVVPPPAVREAWDAFLEPRRDTGTDLRWVVPESWHVTLAFMGRVADRAGDDLDEALAAVAARTTPFTVGVAGGGAFPDPEAAKVLWLGVTEGARELGELAVRCRNAATRCGIEVDGGRFRPHVTVARANGQRVLRWLQVLDAIERQPWQVERFRLVRSQLLPGGAGYQTVGEYDLT
ncbi:MAG TPA: RNA 2',3'-cyclic phosphodiesterase [Propionicimonas sp.]|uniref:RNA 2',3'-cyclic phosphodiesterase n=1 Tax=Propionicimonas sp. TaxID=1955623 RepID=UPI002F4105FF